MDHCIIKVYVTLTENNSEIFYHPFLTNIEDGFKTFKIKLAERYDVLKHSRFEVTWIDDDGDKINILDEDDFSIFLEMKRTAVHVQVDFNSTEKPTHNNFPMSATAVVGSNLNIVSDSVRADLGEKVKEKPTHNNFPTLTTPVVESNLNTVLESVGADLGEKVKEKPTHNNFPILTTAVVGSNLNTVPESVGADLGEKVNQSIFRMEAPSFNAVKRPLKKYHPLKHLLQILSDPGPDLQSRILQHLKSNPALMAAFVKQREASRRSSGEIGSKQPRQLPQMNQQHVEMPSNQLQLSQTSMVEQPVIRSQMHAAKSGEKSEDCVIDDEEVRNSLVSLTEEQALENKEEPQTLTKRASDKELLEIPYDPLPKYTVSPCANESFEELALVEIPTSVLHEKQTHRSSENVPNTVMLEKRSDSFRLDVEVLRNILLDVSRKQTAEVDDSSSDEKEISIIENPKPTKLDSEDSSSDEEEIGAVEDREQQKSDEVEGLHTSETKESEEPFVDDSSEISTESAYNSSFEVLHGDSDSFSSTNEDFYIH